MSDDKKVFEQVTQEIKPAITEFDKAIKELQAKLPEGGCALLLYPTEGGIIMDVVPWREGEVHSFCTATLNRLAEVASAYISQLEFNNEVPETNPELT